LWDYAEGDELRGWRSSRQRAGRAIYAPARRVRSLRNPSTPCTASSPRISRKGPSQNQPHKWIGRFSASNAIRQPKHQPAGSPQKKPDSHGSVDDLSRTMIPQRIVPEVAPRPSKKLNGVASTAGAPSVGANLRCSNGQRGGIAHVVRAAHPATPRAGEAAPETGPSLSGMGGKLHEIDRAASRRIDRPQQSVPDPRPCERCPETTRALSSAAHHFRPRPARFFQIGAAVFPPRSNEGSHCVVNPSPRRFLPPLPRPKSSRILFFQTSSSPLPRGADCENCRFHLQQQRKRRLPALHLQSRAERRPWNSKTFGQLPNESHRIR